MGRIKSHIHKERLLIGGRRGGEIFDCRFSDEFAAVDGMAVGEEPVPFPRRIVRGPAVSRRGPEIRGPAIGGGREEATSQRSDRAKAAPEVAIRQMPFAGHESVVAGRAQSFPPERRIFRQALSARVTALPQGAAGIEHGPAGNTDRATVTALVKAMGEKRSPFGQPVEVRCPDGQLAQSAQGVMGLVIGKQEEKIRPLLPGSGESVFSASNQRSEVQQKEEERHHARQR